VVAVAQRGDVTGRVVILTACRLLGLAVSFGSVKPKSDAVKV